jgi:adenine/guanine phosphoribosyltransferase-like PRPP-binding protein
VEVTEVAAAVDGDSHRGVVEWAADVVGVAAAGFHPAAVVAEEVEAAVEDVVAAAGWAAGKKS